MAPMSRRVLIVGAGFSGAVMARELAEHGGIASLVIDARPHVAGNCHAERDPETGVLVHRYGAHIFHTDRPEIWRYVNRFGEFRPFVNRVRASIDRGIFPLPVNLHTINQFFGRKLNPREARRFLEEVGDRSITEPRNFEEQALRMLGRDLYEAFFRGYTIKQWGCDPRELPASILKRLPVRFDYNDAYYDDPIQGMPVEGYSTVIERMLAHPLIEVRTGTRHQTGMEREFDHVFFTGPLDAYFGFRHGRLGYRTVHWSNQREFGDFQGNAVINYPSSEVPHTRVVEHKHFAPWERHERTFVSFEFSKETTGHDDPFYPKRLAADRRMLARYVEEARGQRGTSFIGRLATYRYMDMHHAIAEAIDFAARFLRDREDGRAAQVFPEAAEAANRAT